MVQRVEQCAYGPGLRFDSPRVERMRTDSVSGIVGKGKLSGATPLSWSLVCVGGNRGHQTLCESGFGTDV